MPLYPHFEVETSTPPPAASSFDRTNFKEQILLDGPEVYFRFDEVSGNVALDQSGFGRNGTYGTGCQLQQDAISGSKKTAYDPKLTFNFPTQSKADANGNVSTKFDFSAVCLIKLLPATNCGVIFNAGNSTTGVLVGKGSGGNPGSNGNEIAGLANYQAYISVPCQFKPGVNLLGITVRARDNLIIFYLNGLPVYALNQVFNPLAGQGLVGFTDNEAFPHALALYSEFALFYSELPPSRFMSYWKAVQLTV